MSKFILEIELNNAAFQDENLIPEIKRILDEVKIKVEENSFKTRIYPITVRDINGNKVCKAMQTFN